MKLKTLSLCSLSAVFLSACSPVPPKQEFTYEAELVRTDYGIVHITADDYSSLGFGEGYAVGEDHVCTVSESIVFAMGERAKYFGMGDKKQHFMSDVVIKALDIPKRAREGFQQQPQEIKDWLTGYVAGFNYYLKDTGRDNIDSWCAGADWVKPITAEQFFARLLAVVNTAPRLAGAIVSAAPPAAKTIALSEANLEAELTALNEQTLGSNAWAFGKEKTDNGRGMLLGNPHYPWSGSMRFWEKHLTIPGKLDIYGVHLVGAPGVAIGFNDKIGWSHTVSDSERVALYALRLTPQDPTIYYYDDEVRSMTKKVVNITVKEKSEPVKHTVWFSHHGPIISLPGAKWNAKTAIAMRDANLNNFYPIAQWKAMTEAQSMDEFIQTHKTWDAMPWVNTMATSHDGRAVFMDNSNVGRLTEEAIALWKERLDTDPLAKAIYRKTNFIVLDGSDSRYEWQAHPESKIGENVPFTEKPMQDRKDYIFNANDSYWLTNVAEPMAEVSPLYGPHGTARSLRTRMNATILSDTSPEGFAGKDGKFSLSEMQSALLNNDSYAAILLRDELVTACRENNVVSYEGQNYNLEASCNVLANYDSTFNLDSQGAVLFREWISHYTRDDMFTEGRLFANGFDIKEPVATPYGLGDKELALQNLARASIFLTEQDIALNATMADTQFAYRGEHKIAVHGGGNLEGVANIIGQRDNDTVFPLQRGKNLAGSKFLSDKGYAINYGTSYLLSLQYTDDGPVAEAFLTYGQTDNPKSEHYVDQTRLFSEKAWRPVLYKRSDIKPRIKSRRLLQAN